MRKEDRHMYDLFGFLGAARAIAWAYLGVVFVVATGFAIFDRSAKPIEHAGEVTPDRKAA
jgi:hypothetical protein